MQSTLMEVAEHLEIGDVVRRIADAPDLDLAESTVLDVRRDGLSAVITTSDQAGRPSTTWLHTGTRVEVLRRAG